MSAVVSSKSYVLIDQGGNPRTEAWMTLEYREQYNTGGIVFDLSNTFRYVETAIVNPLSGAVNAYVPVFAGDYPGDPRSGRLMLFGMGSSLLTINTSGIGVSIASGTQLFLSGTFLSGQTSGQTFSILFSGSVAAQAVGFMSGQQPLAEIFSGVQLSGVRAKAHVVGY